MNMIKSHSRVKTKRFLLDILLFLWMIIIYSFSNQVADISSNTSGNTIRFFVNIISSNKFDEESKEKIISDLQPVVRKLAHFFVYTLGGILLYNLLNTYEIEFFKKVGIAWITGTLYSITDEIHQVFVPGRSGEIGDVLIDSSGVLVGIGIVLLFIKIFKKERYKND